MSIAAHDLEKTDFFNAQNDAASEIWRLLCENIEKVLPAKAFQTWFSPVKPVSFDSNILTVIVPSKFYYEWLEGHYAAQIDNALNEIIGSGSKLIYKIEDKKSQVSQDKVEFKASVNPVTNHPVYSKPVSTVSKNLNSRYTFENFIEGPPNRFARAAAFAVSQSPGKTAYNPLLIYGGVGLGKTHLLQAIGHEVLKQNPMSNVRFISSERFTQDFVESIRENRADSFSAKWRTVDALLLDDVQFLVGRDRTQMEFFHTFNVLHQAGKQIVLTSDKPPRELDGLDERLVSRIGWGLVCDVGPPDYETRLAIIQKFAETENVDLSAEICQFLAENIKSNIRELQGALVRLLAHCSLNGSEITEELAKRALHDLIEIDERRISVDVIQRLVADYYNVAPDLLLAKIRTQPVAKTRMIAMALSVKLTGRSLKQVGKHFGGRDHTTVLHARESFDKWMTKDPEFARNIDEIINNIKRFS